MVGNNAIGWAQFQLNGGWKNTLGVLIGYAVVIGGLIIVMASIDPRQASSVYSGWTKGLLGLQLAILVLYGSNRIIGGIRRDFTGQMIESHRLMPVPSLHAIAGYIFGGASQALSLALVNFILGAVTTRGAGLPTGYWLKANFVMVTFAVFVWTVVAFAALSARGAMFWVVGPVVVFWMSGGALSLLLPGVSVLATPLQGPSVFDARLVNRAPELYGAPIGCQALIAGICVIAAMRKYRRSDDAAFSPLLALSMLAAVALTSAIGVRWFDGMAPEFLHDEGDLDVQLVSSTIALMLFVTAAMCSVAWSEALARRAALRREPLPPRERRVLPPLLGVVLATGIGAAMIYAGAWHWTGDEATAFRRYGVGVLLVHALSIAYLARWIYSRIDRAIVIIVIWMALIWLGPLVIDLIIRSFEERQRDIGTIAAWSPIGCLIALVDPDDANPRIGLLGQFAVALLPVLLYYTDQMRTTRILKRTAAAAEG